MSSIFYVSLSFNSVRHLLMSFGLLLLKSKIWHPGI